MLKQISMPGCVVMSQMTDRRKVMLMRRQGSFAFDVWYRWKNDDKGERRPERNNTTNYHKFICALKKHCELEVRLFLLRTTTGLWTSACACKRVRVWLTPLSLYETPINMCAVEGNKTWNLKHFESRSRSWDGRPACVPAQTLAKTPACTFEWDVQNEAIPVYGVSIANKHGGKRLARSSSIVW